MRSAAPSKIETTDAESTSTAARVKRQPHPGDAKSGEKQESPSSQSGLQINFKAFKCKSTKQFLLGPGPSSRPRTAAAPKRRVAAKAKGSTPAARMLLPKR